MGTNDRREPVLDYNADGTRVRHCAVDFQAKIEAMARSLATDEGRALDQAVAVLIRAGAKIDQIEIVYEQLTEQDGPLHVYRRCYARVRPGAPR